MSNFNIWNQYIKENIICIRNYEKVYKVKNKETGNYFVLYEVDKKKYKMYFNQSLNQENYIKQFQLKNTIPIIEKINTNEFFYLTTEFPLINLEDYLKIRKENITIEEIREILLQLKPHFKLLRENNFIYKTLHLSNIILFSNQIDKISFNLLEFNLNSLIEENQNNKQLKKINDTPLTKSPELLQKKNPISQKSDLWSLGIIIYYLLFREYPYNGKTEVELFEDIISNKKLKITNNILLDDLLSKMLIFNDKERISWNEYFNHNFFKIKKIIKPILPNFNFICQIHSKMIGAYCKNCKQNICENCINYHNPSFHVIISFSEIGLSNIELNKIEFYLNEINNNMNKLNQIKDNIELFFNKMKLVKINTNIYDNNYKNNFKKYFIQCLNVIKENTKIEGNFTGLEILNNYHSFANKTQLKLLNLTKIKTINAHNDSILYLSTFPLGNTISVSKDNSIKIWDSFFNLIQTIKNAHEGWILSLNIKDENIFASCSIDKNIKIWKKDNDDKFILNDIINNAHNNAISKILFYNNLTLISCSYDGNIKFWNKIMNNKFSCIEILTHSNWINSMILINEKNLLISSGLDGTKFWNLKNLQCINYIKDAICQYIGNNLCLIDNGDKIIIGGGNDKIIKIYSFSENKIIKEIDNDFICWGICYLKEKGVFLIVGKSHHLKIYREDNFELIQNFSEFNIDDICGITELKNGLLALYSLDNTIQLYSY